MNRHRIRRKMAASLPILALLLPDALGCGGDEEATGIGGQGAAASCTAGESLACTCPDGDSGEQICGGDGNLGPCEPCGAPATSTASGTGGSGAGATTGTGGASCDDYGDGEPNENEASAFDLGSYEDCDVEGNLIAAVLDGPDDQDWYSYAGEDTSGCAVDPERVLVADYSLRVCKFISCNDGLDDMSCPSGTQAETSPDGSPGCCSAEPFELDPDCNGVSDDATVYIRIDNPDGHACVPYTLIYHF